MSRGWCCHHGRADLLGDHVARRYVAGEQGSFDWPEPDEEVDDTVIGNTAPAVPPVTDLTSSPRPARHGGRHGEQVKVARTADAVVAGLRTGNRWCSRRMTRTAPSTTSATALR